MAAHSEQDLVTVYHAIAHPVRRRILQTLLAGEAPAMSLADGLSASALSQHLTVLKRAALVRERRRGRQRLYSIRPEPLFEPFAWLRQYEAFWQGKLGQLGDYLERTHGTPETTH